jgi:hypothetical protein
MTIAHHAYDLQDGFLHNWLAAGPQVLRLPEGETATAPQAVRRHFYRPELEITGQPVERGPLSAGIFQAGEYQGSWEYYRCQEDHLVDHTPEADSPGYLRSWAYAELVAPVDMEVLLRLATPGPADVWLNQAHLACKDSFDQGKPEILAIPARLTGGTNPVFVRFENLAGGSAGHFTALQVCHPDGRPHAGGEAGISVHTPTLILPRLLKLRRQLEELFARVSLERDVFEQQQRVAFRLPDGEIAAAPLTVRFLNPDRLIFSEMAIEGRPGLLHPLNLAYELAAGRNVIALLPPVHEYYELNMRIKKEIPVWTVGNAPYSAAPYGSYAGRRREALRAAAGQRGLFAEMAKMAAGWWKRVDPQALRAAIRQASLRRADSPLVLAGLLGILERYSHQAEFPGDLAQAVEECALHFEAPADFDQQPGCLILCAACDMLAGQRLPENFFPGDGQPGRARRERGQRRALSAMQEMAARGFADWGSGEALTGWLVALSLLVDLAEAEQVQEMAQVCLDKLFFSLAVGTFRGLPGAPQRRARPEDVTGGLLHPATGVCRLMWGMGVFNHRVEAYASLACVKNYALPGVIAGAAADFSGELWGREQHAARPGPGNPPANCAVYRSPDGMLASTQDYRPGQTGPREHVWQATLGPSAIVFTSHPACSSDNPGRSPGFWTGSVCLPRVAQWKNALVAIYNLPGDDWMRFTHAYFPTFAFDEYALWDGWAFARKGDGYLAITASTGITLVQEGPRAMRELRSPGLQTAWVCHLGRAAQDGDFAAFQGKIAGLPLRLTGQNVAFRTLQGEEIAFDAEGPFLVNGVEVPLAGFPHFENPYTITPLDSQQMDIRYLDTVLRLDFQLS